MIEGYASAGLVHFLFSIFCVYWAQETDRSALLWWLFGFVFAPLAGIVLVIKNNQDKQLPYQRKATRLASRL